MPCGDEWPEPNYEAQNLREQVRFLEASLCSVLSVLEGKKGLVRNTEELLSKVDYKEAGISRKELERWWAQHKEADRRRREREARQLAEKQRVQGLRSAAMAKSTEEKRRALGL